MIPSDNHGLNLHWKMMPDDDHIIYFQNVVFGWHNHCYSWIHTEKWCIMHIHTYKTKKLQNMVSPITKWTPPLNSRRKTGPGHISFVPYWICFPIKPQVTHIAQTSKPHGAVVKRAFCSCYWFRDLKTGSILAQCNFCAESAWRPKIMRSPQRAHSLCGVRAECTQTLQSLCGLAWTPHSPRGLARIRGGV